MAAKKRKTPFDKEESLAKIAQLARMGYNQREIAAEVGLSQPQVSNDLRLIRRKLAESELDDIRVWRARELEVLLDVRRMAYQAWYESMKDAKRVTHESGVSGQFGVDKTITTTEGRVPHNAFLQTILDTSKDIREMLGINEATKIELRGMMLTGAIPWEKLHEQIGKPLPGKDDITLEIEQIISEAEKQKTAKNGSRNGRG